MKQLVAFLSLLFLLALPYSCSEIEIEENMAQFDRAFIPVWYFTQLGKFEQANVAFLQLESAWASFKSQSTPLVSNTKDWKYATGQMNDWILETHCALGEKNQDLALNQLDHARYELIDWRWRRGIDYYLDYAWDLEAAIDVARSVAIDPATELPESREFQKRNNDVLVSWQALKGQLVDPDLFHLSEEDYAQYLLRKSELGTLIEKYLPEAHCMPGACDYEEAMDSLRYAFLNYVKVFGDFNFDKNSLSAFQQKSGIHSAIN